MSTILKQKRGTLTVYPKQNAGNKPAEWVELYAGPGDGVKRRRARFPVSLKFPDDFLLDSPIESVLYKRWERVLTLVEDQIGKPRMVHAYLYVLDGTVNPLHRRTTHDKFVKRS